MTPTASRRWLDQNIAILGAGREGLAAADYLRSLSPEIKLTLISEPPAGTTLKEQLHRNDHLVVCPLSEAQLDRFDLLIRSPGISPYRAELQQAQSAGVKFTTPSSLWFAAHPEARTICVTGTKGKSTTSAMIAHILRSGGYRVSLAGNIGLPLLSCDDENVDWWVIELSSYQLSDLEASPSIGVLLNLTPEHLDWHGSEAVYRQDKLRLAQLCSESSLVVNAADVTLASELADHQGATWFNSPAELHVSGTRVLDDGRGLPVNLPGHMPGHHNLSNAAAALTVAREIGADLDQASRSLETFRGLPHRLQIVGEKDGVGYINDSISSTPVSTEAALTALSKHTITLIVGGLDRGLDWTPYMQSFSESALNAVIAVPDNGASVLETMRAAGLKPRNGLHLAQDLQEAVGKANRLTGKGGLILLSPGAPSFPQFRDFEDRGRQFTQMCGFKLTEWDVF